LPELTKALCLAKFNEQIIHSRSAATAKLLRYHLAVTVAGIW